MTEPYDDPLDEELDEATLQEGVAIVGLACRFPGADDAEHFWRNLRDGVESISRLDDEVLAALGVPAERFRAPGYVKAAALLDGVEDFDASFFGMTPREAELSDPQHRLFLECCWQALEDAALDPRRQGLRTGVYGGCAPNQYAVHNLLPDPGVAGSVSPNQMVVASEKDYMASLVSYRLGFTGPAINVQTACSSALVAVHLAAQSLLTFECDVALAGASSVQVPHLAGYRHVPGGVQSRDGHCRPFDAAADGTVFGSGVGVVVLKRLEDALSDGDRVWAVILGSAVNNDGSVKVSRTAPGLRGQAEVIAAAQALANVEPRSVRYVEAHGTGTALGDPVEVAALEEVFRAATDDRGFCALGSVKSNIGHADAAAGIAGLIKTVLALDRRQLPPSLHFERPNPEIDFTSSPFFVSLELSGWPDGDGPLRAGVSSFGMGGTNAHAVVQEAPAPVPSGPSRQFQLLQLSARTATALERRAVDLERWLGEHPRASLADVAHTLRRRPALEHRRTLVAADLAEARQRLDRGAGVSRSHRSGEAPRVVFLFPGQGTQYPGMGADLYRDEPVFREAVDHCAEVLTPLLGRDLRPLLLGREDGAAEALARTGLTQPALFVVEHALAELWASWGIEPEAMLGHSVGELVAACRAGVFDLEDALELVVERGRLMGSMVPGAMLTVPLPEAEVEVLLAKWEGLAPAAFNAPRSTVVSGPAEAVEALAEELGRQGVETRRLHTSHAFHSATMEPAVEPFTRAVAAKGPRPPQRPFLSNVTGTWIREKEAIDPAYWGRQLRAPVRFAPAFEELLGEPDRVFLEVGPGRALCSLAAAQGGWSPERLAVPSLRHPGQEGVDGAFLLEALGRLWGAGVEVDWEAFRGDEERRVLLLPLYPFERRRHWVEPPVEGQRPKPAVAGGGRRDPARFFHLPAWQTAMPPARGTADAAAVGPWLLFRREGKGTEAALARELARRGVAGPVVEVFPGKAFGRRPDGAFELRFDSMEDHTRLLNVVAEEAGAPVTHLVHLFHLGEVEDESGRGSFRPLAALAGALAREPGVARHLTVVADRLWRVAGTDPVMPARATLLGPARTLPHEAPGCTCRVVDLPVAAALAAERWAGVLADEVLAGPPPADEREVAWRDGGRWVHGLRPLRLEGAEGTPPRLRRKGVYLITGGLGGLGLELAAYLARTVAARLVLVGRSPLPPREEWEARLAENDGDSTAERIRRVRALEEAGAEVMVVAADVTDAGATDAAVAAARERFGALHGVFHVAGRPGAQALASLDRGDVEAVLGPKVDGVRHLAAALEEEELDFLLAYASLLGLSGGPGQAAYSAANAYLDAFAHTRSAAGFPTLAVDWDLWAEVGMGARTLGRYGPVRHRPGSPLPAGDDHPLLGRPLEHGGAGLAFATVLDPKTWFLAEHRILDTPVLPGVAYLELARAALAARHGEGTPVEVRDLIFLEPLRVPEGTRRELRTTLDPEGPDLRLRVESRDAAAGGEWRLHARCSVALLTAGEVPRDPSVAGLFGTPCQPVDPPEGDGGASTVYWGEHWRRLGSARLGDNAVLLELPEALRHELSRLPLHPALLDLATAAGAVLQGGGNYIPAAYGRVAIHHPLEPRLLARFRRHGEVGATLRLDVELLAEDGRVLLTADGFTLRRASGGGRRDGAEELLAAGLSSAEGAEALHRLLSRVTIPQVVVSPRDLSPESLAAPAKTAPVAERRPAPPPGEGEAGNGTAPRSTNDAPRDALESELASLWCEVLGYDQVGIHDDFFELGGQSLVALQLLGRIRDGMAVDLPVDALFSAPTVAELAERVRQLRGAVEEPGAGGGALPPLLHRADPAVAPLSFQQERLWFLDQMEGGSNFYNISTAFRLRGPLPVSALRRAVDDVVKRHEALRSVFVLGDDGEPEQRLRSPEPVPVPVLDLSTLPVARAEEEARRVCVVESLWTFDLERGPLVRTVLVRLSEEDHVVTLTLHHVVSDGWTMGVLVDEVTALLEARIAGRPAALPEPQLQYGDFAWSQRHWLRGELLESELAWWHERLAGVPPLLELSPDFPRPERKDSAGSRVPLELPVELSDALRDLARQRRTTLYAVLLAGFKVLLHFYSGEDDVVVGSNTSYRNWPESRGAVGFFANLLPLRTSLSGAPTFIELVERVRETTAGAFSHQHVPLHKLVEELRPPRSLAYDPLVQVAFELERREARGFGRGLAAEPFGFELDTAQFDFSIWMNDVGGALTGTCEYRSSLFRRETAKWRGEQYRRLLEAACAEPEVRLGDLVRRLEEAEEEQRSRRRRQRKQASSQRLHRRRRGTVEVVKS